MRLKSILGGLLLLRFACSLPSPPTKDVPTLQEREALIEDKQPEGISHLETRGATSDIARACLNRLGIGSSSRPPPVPLDTPIDLQLGIRRNAYIDNQPPLATWSPIIGTNQITFQAFNYHIGGSPVFMGVVFLRNDGPTVRHVSLIRNPRENQAGRLNECIDTYELAPHSTSPGYEFNKGEFQFKLRLED